LIPLSHGERGRRRPNFKMHRELIVVDALISRQAED